MNNREEDRHHFSPYNTPSSTQFVAFYDGEEVLAKVTRADEMSPEQTELIRTKPELFYPSDRAASPTGEAAVIILSSAPGQGSRLRTL